MLMLRGILLVTLSSPILISPRAPTTTGIVSVFISHIQFPNQLYLSITSLAELIIVIIIIIIIIMMMIVVVVVVIIIFIFNDKLLFIHFRLQVS